MTTTKAKTDRMAWYKMDAGAFITATLNLSNHHVAIYIKLMSIYWTSGHKLPDDMILKRQLAIVGTEQEAAISEMLAEFFPKDPLGKHCHLELDRQLTGITEYSAAQSERASKPRPKPDSSGEDDDYSKF